MLITCAKHAQNNLKVVKCFFLKDYAYKSQDFAQSQKFFAQLHDCETVTWVRCEFISIVVGKTLNQVHKK